MNHKPGRITIITLAILFTAMMLTTGSASAEKVDYKAEIQKEYQIMKDRGEALTIKEVIPENKIPKEKNAALNYQEAMDEVEFDYNIDRKKSPSEISKVVVSNQEIKDQVKDNQGVLEMMSEAYQMGQCRFDLEYEKGFEMELPKYANYRRIMNFLSSLAFLQIADDKNNEAVKSCAYGLRFSRDMVNGTALKGRRVILISMIVQLAGDSTIASPLKYMVEKGIKTDYTPVIKEIDAMLAESKDQVALSIEVERLVTLDVMDKLINADPETKMKIMKAVADPKKVPANEEQILADKLYYMQTMRKLIEASKKNDTKTTQAVFDEIENSGKNHVLSAMLIPNISKVIERNEENRKMMTNLRDKLKSLNTGK